MAVLVLSSAPFAQQQVIEPWQIPCKEEAVQPNLEVKTRKHIFGQLHDPTGAAFEESKVLVRKQNEKGKFVDYRSAVTDKEGHFNLETVEPGKYRFLPGPNRGWKQPKSIECGNGTECEVKLVLEINPTDQPYAGCPIQ